MSQKRLKGITTALLNYCLLKPAFKNDLGEDIGLSTRSDYSELETKALKFSVPHCASDIFCMDVIEVKIQEAVKYQNGHKAI